jgi:putative tricarboxylic transport membrane protein
MGLVLLAMSLLSLLFMNDIVAAPKVLFGRQLMAMSPKLFPYIIISMLALLTAIFLYLEKQVHTNEPADVEEVTIEGWKRGAALFAAMLAYALLMQPIGFLLSTIFAITVISRIAGNRNWLQIGILAVSGPVLLYLAATRLLAVSLPELSAIEFAYAALLGA